MYLKRNNLALQSHFHFAQCLPSAYYVMAKGPDGRREEGLGDWDREYAYRPRLKLFRQKVLSSHSKPCSAEQ
jgi:hypothetical protein